MLDEWQKELQEKGSTDLAVKVKAGAKQNEIKEVREERLKIDIKAPAQKGKANQELKKLLASRFNVARDNVRILHGGSSSFKKIRIKDHS